MFDAIIDRPLLANILILFLIWIGVRAIKPRAIRYRQLYILPSVFLAVSANQLFSAYAFSTAALLSWIAATIVAGVASWRMAEKTPIQIKRETGMIELPGTWITLAIILVFIATRFYIGRQLSVSPELRADEGFITWILVSTGIICGYYLGRSASFMTDRKSVV